MDFNKQEVFLSPPHCRCMRGILEVLSQLLCITTCCPVLGRCYLLPAARRSNINTDILLHMFLYVGEVALEICPAWPLQIHWIIVKAFYNSANTYYFLIFQLFKNKTSEILASEKGKSCLFILAYNSHVASCQQCEKYSKSISDQTQIFVKWRSLFVIAIAGARHLVARKKLCA